MMGSGRRCSAFQNACSDGQIVDMKTHESNSDEAPSTETVVEGIGVVPGIAVGTVHRYQIDAPGVDRTHVDASEVESELDLLDDALHRAEQELEKVRASSRRQKTDWERMGPRCSKRRP